MLFSQIQRTICLIGVGILCFTSSASAQDAADLAAKLSAAIEDGDSVARLKLQTSGGAEKITLQIQVKARRTAGKTEVVYQVLWPSDHKGESVLLKQENGGAPKGYSFTLPQTVKTLGAAQMGDSIFGSDLAYQDVVENFFRWESQKVVGNETVNRADCVILESKPGSNDSTPYGSVKSWIDPNKMVALRVEKYDSAGKLIRRIDAERVIKDDKKRDIPASLAVQRTGSGTKTELDGSNIRHDVKYSDRDFTKPAMADFKIPR